MVSLCNCLFMELYDRCDLLITIKTLRNNCFKHCLWFRLVISVIQQLTTAVTARLCRVLSYAPETEWRKLVQHATVSVYRPKYRNCNFEFITMLKFAKYCIWNKRTWNERLRDMCWHWSCVQEKNKLDSLHFRSLFRHLNSSIKFNASFNSLWWWLCPGT